MSIRTRTTSTPWAALFFALLGLAWCGYIAFPTGNPAPCATSGCALFRDSRIAGVSLWWVGGAYFFLLAIVCLRGNRALARIMALVALLLDSLLLLVMFFTAPCFDCLVVAIFFACTYYNLRSGGEGWFVSQQTPSLLLPIWFGLFLGNAVLAANERIPLYSMGNTRSTDVRIYFSPSCGACREAILRLGHLATLYPVEEKSGDMDSIIRLGSLLKANVPLQEALTRSITPSEPVPYLPFYDRILLSLQLVRNRAIVLRQGFQSLPLIQLNGLPSEDKHEPLAPPENMEGSGGPSPEAPVYNLAPAYGDPAAGGAGQGPSSPVRQPGGQHGSGPQSGRNGQRDHADQGNLMDLLQNADTLARCSRTSGQPCD